MCCAISSYHLERFYSQETAMDEEDDFPAIDSLTFQNFINFSSSPEQKYRSKKSYAEKTDKNNNKKKSLPLKKRDTNTTVMDRKKTEKAEKKKKKWKPLSLTETGFTMSLFPRPVRPEMVNPEEEAKILRKIEAEQDDYEKTMDKYKDFDAKNCDPYEGKCKGKDRFMRADRDRKIRKAGRQVKDKYCTSLKNNDGRKKLYIHHRLFKLINLEMQRMTFLPSSKPNYVINENLYRNKSTDSNRSRLKPVNATNSRPAPVQNLKHALHRTNAPTDISSDIVNVLINLQHRELTPEDYELLLRLDESVAPKTISRDILSSLKTDTVTSESAGELCAVCMDPYEIGQNRKYLPCNHVFHTKCIDMWLENSSQNCPIDNLPIDPNS